MCVLTVDKKVRFLIIICSHKYRVFLEAVEFHIVNVLNWKLIKISN